MEKNPTMLFVVAAAFLNQTNEILVQKRPTGKMMAGLWEFPGGKVEAGEEPESALSRELKEELGVVVDPQNLVPATFASEPLGDKNLLLLLYICREWEGEPQALESTEIAWVTVEEMKALPMPPADRPFVDYLAKLL